MSEQGLPRKKPIKQFLENRAPWMPVDYELHHVTCIQALERGQASAHEQGQALKWIIETLSGYYEIGYFPGEDGRRDSDFMQGRRFVGQQIVKMLKLNPSAMRRNDPNADAGEPQS